MPKLKESPDKQQDNEIIARITYGMSKRDISISEISLTARMTKQTFYNRKKRPELFTLEELRRISKRIGLSIPQILGEAPIEI